MKRIPYLLLVTMSLLLLSCCEKAKTLKPVSQKIRGPFAECFEVVVRDYKIIGNQVNIEFLRIKDGMMEPQVIAEFLDANGNVIASSKADGTMEQFRFLLANKVGESSTLTFAFDNGSPTQVRFNSLAPNTENDKVSEITLKKTLEEPLEETIDGSLEEIIEKQKLSEEGLEESLEETVEEIVALVEAVDVVEAVNEIPVGLEEEIEAETSVQSTNSKDWDKALDDFESYVDQYINLMKKANSGDISVITEYVSFFEKAEKLEKDLDAAKNEMTKAQMKRYLKISEKMMNAAIEMY